jgi:protein-tyrosine phosphatase|nr:low molecular weight protein-tyrosine-phosphatase [uncultured Pedobacter sp.]
MKILMVCLGNICRSPLAEGIMQHLVKEKGLDWQIDSAGTGGYHIGSKPDSRSIKVAKNHGIDITAQAARKFSANDFDNFDCIVVMDKQNYKDVVSLAQTAEQKEKVRLLINNDAVPDPYYDDSLFEPVFQLINTNCAKLLTALQNDKS